MAPSKSITLKLQKENQSCYDKHYVDMVVFYNPTAAITPLHRLYPLYSHDYAAGLGQVFVLRFITVGIFLLG